MWEVVDNLMVSFTTSGFISDARWAAFVEDLEGKAVTRMICSTVGDVEVTSVQRKLAAEVSKSRALPIAVVTDAKLVRGMVTAVSWLGVDIKAFSWIDVSAALKHLKVTTATQSSAIAVIERFRRGAL